MLNLSTWEGVVWLLFFTVPIITLLGLAIAAVVWEIKYPIPKPKPKDAQPTLTPDA